MFDEQINIKAYKAIDTMCRPTYCDPQVAKSLFAHYELQVMAKNTFAGVMKKLKLKPGEEWRILAELGKSSVPGMLAEMDEIGVELVFMDPMVLWSWREHQLIKPCSLENLVRLIKESEGRIIGGVGYNPFRLKESLEEVEKAVREHGFKYVWFHPSSFGLTCNDKKCYPLYVKCIELGIPCCIQVGHSAEPLPSWVGYPMHADEVALDLPELTLVLTHTGWPWVAEWISMIWRHPNVYGNIGAYYPLSLDPSIIKFIDGRGREKVMWATNGLGLTRCKREFLQLPIKEKTKQALLWDNAIKIFNLGDVIKR